MLPGNLVFVHPSIDTLTDLTKMIVGGVINYKHLHPKSYFFFRKIEGILISWLLKKPADQDRHCFNSACESMVITEVTGN